MKVGDVVNVDIAGHKVADAKVKSLGDGQVTLVVPATEVVMAVRTELDPAAVAPKQEATHVVIGTEDGTIDLNPDGSAHFDGTVTPSPEVVQTPPVVETPVETPAETPKAEEKPVVEDKPDATTE